MKRNLTLAILAALSLAACGPEPDTKAATPDASVTAAQAATTAAAKAKADAAAAAAAAAAARQAQFGESLKNGLAEGSTVWIHVPAELFQHQTGKLVEGALKAGKDGDGAGYLASGPYITLPKGAYDVKFEGSCTGAPSAAIIDVTSGGAGTSALAQARPFQCDAATNAVKLDLKEETTGIEFRVLFQQTTDLTFNGVSIRRTPR